MFWKAGRYLVILILVGSACAILSCTAVFAQDGLADARTAFRAGDIDGAIARAQAAIADSQDRAVISSCYMVLGFSYLKKNDLDAAVASFSKVANEFADQKARACEAWLRLAYLLDKKGDTPGAKAAFQKLIDIQAPPAYVSEARMRLLGQAYREAMAGKITYAAAHQMADSILAAYPDDAKTQVAVRIAVAEALLHQGQFLKSIDASRSSLKLLAGAADASGLTPFDFTTSYGTLGGEEQKAWARVYLASVQLARGYDYAGHSIKSFIQVTRDCADFAGPCAEAQYRVGESLAKRGHTNEALVELNRVLSDYAGNRKACAWATYRIGECLEWQHKYAESEKTWKDIVAKYSDIKVLYGLATLRICRGLLSTHDLAAATTQLSKITTAFPAKLYAAAQGMRFQMLLMQHKPAEAAAIGREVVANADYSDSVVPGSYTKASIELQVANCLVMQKDYAGAIVEAQKVASTAGAQPPDGAAAALLVGDCYRHSGKLAEAAEAYQKVVTDYASNKGHAALAKFRRAVCLYDAKQLVEAEAEFASFLDDYSSEADGESVDRANSYVAELAK